MKYEEIGQEVSFWFLTPTQLTSALKDLFYFKLAYARTTEIRTKGLSE